MDDEKDGRKSDNMKNSEDTSIGSDKLVKLCFLRKSFVLYFFMMFGIN